MKKLCLNAPNIKLDRNDKGLVIPEKGPQPKVSHQRPDVANAPLTVLWYTLLERWTLHLMSINANTLHLENAWPYFVMIQINPIMWLGSNVKQHSLLWWIKSRSFGKYSTSLQYWFWTIGELFEQKFWKISYHFLYYSQLSW